jgi:hypothetical protein
MVVGRVGDAGAQDVRVDVDGPDDSHEEGQELRVGVRVVAGVEKVLALVGSHRPVVVLARAVDAPEGLLVQQCSQVVPRPDLAHHVHHDHVVIRAGRRGLEHGRDLELGGGHLVVAGLGGNAHPPELAVEVHHEREHALADGAQVLILELLPLGRGSAEEGSPGQDEVGPKLGQAAVYQEVLLLGPDGREHPLDGVTAEPAQDAQGLLAQGLLRAQQRDLVVQGLARVGDEGGRDGQGDAVRLDLQEDRACHIPGGVAARLEGRADAARGERRCVRLALDQALAGEFGQDGGVADRVEERVVLLCGGAGEGHEPVGVVRGAVGRGPLLHALGDRVGDRRVERLQAIDRAA